MSVSANDLFVAAILILVLGPVVVFIAQFAYQSLPSNVTGDRR